MRKIIKSIVAVTGVAAAATVAYKLLKNNDNKDYIDATAKEKSTFDKLIDNQFVCGELDDAPLAAWVREQSEKTDAQLIYFIAKPTKNTAKMFNVAPLPEQLDIEHSLLQAAVDKEKCKPVAVRLINFYKLNDKVAELLKDKEYAVIDNK